MSFADLPIIYKETYWYYGVRAENKQTNENEDPSSIIHNRHWLYKLMTSLGTPKLVEKGSGRIPNEIRSKIEGNMFDHVEVYRITHTTNCKCIYILITSPYGSSHAELQSLGYIKIQPIYNTSAISFMMAMIVPTHGKPTVMSPYQLSSIDAWGSVQND
jgi:hypothetical protein